MWNKIQKYSIKWTNKFALLSPCINHWHNEATRRDENTKFIVKYANFLHNYTTNERADGEKETHKKTATTTAAAKKISYRVPFWWIILMNGEAKNGFHYHTDSIHKKNAHVQSETLAMNEIVYTYIPNAIVIIHCETFRRHDGNSFKILHTSSLLSLLFFGWL